MAITGRLQLERRRRFGAVAAAAMLAASVCGVIGAAPAHATTVTATIEVRQPTHFDLLINSVKRLVAWSLGVDVA